jgi:putative SOS response-associated peptidase YedK
MCGRFTLTSPRKVLNEFFPLLDIPEVQPRYNIAPTQPVLAVGTFRSMPGPRSRLCAGVLFPTGLMM